jgi:hypothetical protein
MMLGPLGAVTHALKVKRAKIEPPSRQIFMRANSKSQIPNYKQITNHKSQTNSNSQAPNFKRLALVCNLVLGIW